jgi:hypothetical protein
MKCCLKQYVKMTCRLLIVNNLFNIKKPHDIVFKKSNVKRLNEYKYNF